MSKRSHKKNKSQRRYNKTTGLNLPVHTSSNVITRVSQEVTIQTEVPVEKVPLLKTQTSINSKPTWVQQLYLFHKFFGFYTTFIIIIFGVLRIGFDIPPLDP